MKKILFLHGLESGPGGKKSRWLAERYGGCTPQLTTGDFLLALQQAREAIAALQPELVIGSSYGGALLLVLMQEGTWRGPALFLAQAGVKFGFPAELPAGSRAILIHSADDEVVPIAGSEALAAGGGPGVELIRVEGKGHRLEACVTDGTLEGAIARLLD